MRDRAICIINLESQLLHINEEIQEMTMQLECLLHDPAFKRHHDFIERTKRRLCSLSARQHDAVARVRAMKN